MQTEYISLSMSLNIGSSFYRLCILTSFPPKRKNKGLESDNGSEQ